MDENQRAAEIIASIYDCVLDPAKWEIILDEIAEYFGGTGVIVMDELRLAEKRGTIISFLNSSNYNDVDLNAAYFGKFGEYEARSHHALMTNQEQIEFISKLPDHIETMLHPSEAFYDKNDPLYAQSREICNTLGFSYRTGTVLNQDSWKIDRLSVQFSEAIDPYSRFYRERAKRIFPHLSKALRLSRSMQISNEGKSSIDGFDHIDLGVCIISPQFYPIYTNDEFNKINDLYGLFRLNLQNEIRPSIKKLKDYFEGFFEGKTTHGRFGANPRKESLLLRLDDQDTSLFVEVGPLRFHPELGIFPNGSLLIQLLDVGRVEPENALSLSRFFPLSDAEIEVAKLILQGFSNHQIAEIRGRTSDTIKTQIRSLYNKTYTNGRAELSHLSRALERSFSHQVTQDQYAND